MSNLNKTSEFIAANDVIKIKPRVKGTIIERNDKYPKFLQLLCFVEMWERFSYYGMRALLVLFLTSKLGFEDKSAYAIYSIFAALSYAGPVLGGILADRFFGFRNMIISGGIIITIGHALMAINILSRDLTFLGLAFIAIGTGLFKGNISNLLGDCYKDDNEDRARGFTLFYVGVNFGGFIAAVACGYISSIYGWHYGFGLAGIGMLIGLIVFLKYQNILGTLGLAPKKKAIDSKLSSSILSTMFFCIISIVCAVAIAFMFKQSELFVDILKYFGLLILVILIYIITTSASTERRNLITLSIFVFFLMAFFGIEMQLGSLINLFTQRNIENVIFGIQVPASISQSINPLSIIIFGFMIGNFIKISPKYDNIKFAFGLFTMAIAFLILYLGCVNADEFGKVHYLYLLTSMSFIGLGEVCIAPFVLNKASYLAPVKLRGFIMGVVMLSLAFSNLVGIVIAEFMSVPSVNGVVNYLESLAIYKTGFLNIAACNVVLTAIFLVIVYIMKKYKFSKQWYNNS